MTRALARLAGLIVLAITGFSCTLHGNAESSAQAAPPPVATISQPASLQPASVSGLPDLNCPNAQPKPPPGPGTPQLSPKDYAIPSLAVLGDLARPSIREPQSLDASLIREFGLQGGRPRRFAIWGDSHIAAGPMPTQLVQAIRNRGETVGQHFLPPTMGRVNVRLPVLHGYCIGQGWTTDLAHTSPALLQAGPALADRSATAGPESYLWLDLRSADRRPVLRGLSMVYRPSGEETRIDYSINDEPEQHVTLTAAGTPSVSEMFSFASPTPVSILRLRVSAGRLVLQGFTLDYIKPPQVMLDVFGLPGATSRGWATVDPAYLAQSLHGETYDAVVLEYGTNEGIAVNFTPEKYGAQLTRALTNLRQAFPQASCVLVGPPDRGVLVKNSDPSAAVDLLVFSRIDRQIATIQADVGRTFHCAVWDWQDYMGGPGGVYGWVYNHPILIGRDLTHLTVAGYRQTALALAKSLGWGDTP